MSRKIEIFAAGSGNKRGGLLSTPTSTDRFIKRRRSLAVVELLAGREIPNIKPPGIINCYRVPF